jgi:hypothetical protein
MKNRRGLEVAHRLVIHVYAPCTITVTALPGRRMLAHGPREAVKFTEQKRKALQSGPLKGYIKRH